MRREDDNGLAQQLRNSTDQLAQVKRELEIERNSNQLLKNKVDDLRQEELAAAENGVVVDISKVELEVGVAQLEKDRDLLRDKLAECERSGKAQNDEIAALESSLAELREQSLQLSSDLQSAVSARAHAEASLEQHVGMDAGSGGTKASDAQQTEAQVRVAALERELEQMKNAQADAAAMQTRLDEAQNELEVSNAALEEARREATLANEQLSEIHASRAQDAVESAEGSNLEARVVELKERNLQLSGELESALSALAQADTSLEQPGEEDRASGRNTAADAQQAAAQARIAELERELDQVQQAQRDVVVVQARLDEVQSEFEAKSAALDEARHEAMQVKEQLAEIQAANDTAGLAEPAQLDALRAALTESEAKNVELQAKLEASAVAQSADSGRVETSALAGSSTDTAADIRADAIDDTEGRSGKRAKEEMPTAERAAAAAGDDAQTSARSHQDAAGRGSVAVEKGNTRDARDTGQASVNSAATAAQSIGSDARGAGDEKSQASAADSRTSADGSASPSPSGAVVDPGPDAKAVAEVDAGSTGSDKVTATQSGYVPSGWRVPDTIPDKKERDKLTDIKGVGPKLEGVLHANGIYFFRQIAQLDAAGLDELQAQMPEFRGRIQRDNWLGQAADLHRKKYGEAP